MTASATAISPLLPPPSAPPASTYGSTAEDGHEPALRQSEEEEVIKSEPAKAHKEFKEIALLCFGLWTSVYCAALNASITANLQIEIGSYFKAGHLASWLGGSYLLGVAALTPLWGRLSNIIGRRAAIITAMILFTSGTLGCAVSPSMGVILLSRLVAGCGGGGLLTVTAIIISDLVSLQDRGLYQGYVNLLFGAGSASGAIFGGAVADRFGWRWAFGMQVLPLLVSFSLILWKVHVPAPINSQTPWQLLKRIDWLGAFLIITSVTSLMLSLSLHSASGLPFSHPAVYGLLGLFVASTIGFWACETYHATEPLIPMSLLTMRTPSLVLTAFLLLTMTGFARLFMLPLYLHVVRGFNGSQTGFILLPSSIVGSAGSLFAGWYMQKTGAYKRITIICSIIPMISSLSFLTWGVDANVHRVWIEMALASFGGGVVITTFLTALIAAVSKEHMAIAISASYLFRSLGQVLGVALTGALQQLVLTSSLAQRLPDADPEIISRIIHEPSVAIPRLPSSIHTQAVLAYLASINAVFFFSLIVGFGMLASACLMKAYSLPGR